MEEKPQGLSETVYVHLLYLLPLHPRPPWLHLRQRHKSLHHRNKPGQIPHDLELHYKPIASTYVRRGIYGFWKPARALRDKSITSSRGAPKRAFRAISTACFE